jgi:uncharacterized protein (DUF952 family)
MTAAPIYHIVTEADWQEARSRGELRPSSLAAEGFVHCSILEQIPGTLAAHFSGRTDLLILRIDRSRLSAEVRFEAAGASGVDGAFPHIYGPVELSAIVGVESVPENDTSSHIGLNES